MWLTIVITMLIAGFIFWIGGGFAKEEAAEQKNYSFHRMNSVEGILRINDREIHTYNMGYLSFDDTITIKFYNSFNRPTRINDIYFNKESLFAYANPEMDWREKAEYALNALKQAATRGACTLELVAEIEDVVLEVDEMNRLMEENHLYQSDANSEDYSWK